MPRNILTSAEIQAKIDAGGTVLYKNRTYKKGDTAPNDATILLDYPLWNSNLSDANAQAINHFQIYGTPNDGDSIGMLQTCVMNILYSAVVIFHKLEVVLF
jgi:hypothetical protein